MKDALAYFRQKDALAYFRQKDALAYFRQKGALAISNPIFLQFIAGYASC
jgi:hypothetical protein